MKKIVYIVNNISPKDEYLILKNIFRNLDEKQYSVSVVSLFSKNTKKQIRFLSKHKVKYYNLFMPKFLVYTIGFLKLKKIIKNINPDIIHVYGKRASFVSRRLKYKKIITTHTNLDEYSKLFGFFIKRIYSKYDAIIATSKTIKKSYKLKSIKVIHPVFDINTEYSKVKERAKLDISKGKIVYLYEGNFDNYNRIKDLLNAFDIHSSQNDLLLLVGAGKLSKYCLENASSKVRVLPKGKDYLKYYAAADIFVSFSESEELEPNIYKAMIYGLPLLLVKNELYEEIIKKDSNTYLGEIFNWNFLKKKLRLESNLSLKTRDAIKKYAKDTFVSNENLGAIAEYETIYKKVMN